MTVNAAAANTLEITGLTSPVIAGTSSTITVTAWDRYGNIARDYTGSIHSQVPIPPQFSRPITRSTAQMPGCTLLARVSSSRHRAPNH
jgi:hypothetical protein